MITKTLTASIDLDTVETPYTYAFSASSTCVTFDTVSQSGISSSSQISTIAYFEDVACMESEVVNLQITGANGCSQSIQIFTSGLCDDFSVNLTQIEDYKFQAVATAPGCTTVDFTWFYNDGPFNVVEQNNTNHSSVLELEIDPANTSRIANSTVTVQAHDCSNCPTTEVINFDICSAFIPDKVVHLHCQKTTNGTVYSSSYITLDEPIGCTSDTDWSTLDIDLPTGITYTSFLNRETSDTSYVFQADSDVEPGVYTGTWAVRDEYGVWSNLAEITFVVRSCNPLKTITIPDQVINIDCVAVTPGDTIEINIEDNVFSTPGTVIDWSTWSLFAVPTYNSPSIVLTTDANGDHIIQYETNAPTILNDVFSFSVCDTNGNCSDATTYTVLECITAPTANADADCVACNSSVAIDVLANDTSPNLLDITSVEIDATPTNGTVAIQSDGTITYTPNAGFEGVDTFDYTVADVFGERSAAATVTVTVICAGADAEVTICNS